MHVSFFTTILSFVFGRCDAYTCRPHHQTMRKGGRSEGCRCSQSENIQGFT